MSEELFKKDSAFDVLTKGEMTVDMKKEWWVSQEFKSTAAKMV